MREILFRGFRPCEDGDKTAYVEGKAVNGRWVYGSLIIFADGDTYICYPDAAETLTKVDVLPSTAGQHINKDDKNGVKIFDGDIVRITMPLFSDNPIVCTSEVFFEGSSWRVHWGGTRDDTRLDDFSHTMIFEVIGNTHEEGRDERID